jgi:hypothetical protein
MPQVLSRGLRKGEKMASLQEAFGSLTGSGIPMNIPVDSRLGIRSQNPPEAIEIPEGTASTLAKQFRESKEQCAWIQQELSQALSWTSIVHTTWNEISTKVHDLHSYFQTMPGYMPSPDTLNTWLDVFTEFKKQGDDIIDATSTEVSTLVEQKTKDLAISKKNMEHMCALFDIVQKETQPLIDRLFSINCTCPVCYDKPINVCNVPCGHTCCTDCHEKMKTTCPICNMNIRESVKIYYSV